jgi:hypothetical protein
MNLSDEKMAEIITICRLCGHQVVPAGVQVQWDFAWRLIEQRKKPEAKEHPYGR